MITSEDELTEQWLANVYSAQHPSAQLQSSVPIASVTPMRGRGRRALNLFAGLGGVVVVAVGVAVAAVELSSHHNAGPAPSQSVSNVKFPYYGPAGLPSPAQPLVPPQRGRGSATLSPFRPNEPYYVQFTCSGPGSFRFQAIGGSARDNVPRCNGAITTVREPLGLTSVGGVLYAGVPATLRITASPSTRWEIIVVQKGSNALPPFGSGGLPSPADVLISATMESGSVTLPAFTPTRPYYIEYSCVGTFGPFEIVASESTVHWLTAYCGSVVGGAILDPPSTEILGKPVVLHIVAPQKMWEIEVVQAGDPGAPPTPIGFTAPHGARVLVPLTFGTGVTSLKAFAPTGYWSLETVCTGSGYLRVVSATGVTLSQVACGGAKYGAILGSEQPPPTSANPQLLTVQVDPTSTWIVLAYQA